MRMIVSLGLVGVLALAGYAPDVKAGFAPVFVNTTPAGGFTSFNYNLVFTTVPPAERLEMGNGSLNPGVAGSQDFLTIYDIPGFVLGQAGPGFFVQIQPVGVNGPLTGPPDDPALMNVTFKYALQVDVLVDTIFPGFQIGSTFSDQGNGFYTSQFTDNDGRDNGAKIGEIGSSVVPTAVPALVPEPGSLPLLIAGILGLLGYWRSRRV